MAGNSFSILKTIYRYIHFGNYERIQLKTGEAPLARGLSC